jgi:hypothetical protein
VRAEVKSWLSEDFPDGKSSPDDSDDCCVEIQANIGPVGGDGADTFEFTVCTPRGLARRLDADGRPYWGRGTLVVGHFSWDAVEAAMHQYVRSVSGEDWAELAAKLSRVMRWEFEDYQSYTDE